MSSPLEIVKRTPENKNMFHPWSFFNTKSISLMSYSLSIEKKSENVYRDTCHAS
jgi:hypothetical protein